LEGAGHVTHRGDTSQDVTNAVNHEQFPPIYSPPQLGD
jgi:hypothetical protein